MTTLIQRNNGTIIYFDTAETVVKNFPNKVTTHPIEEGSPITDHIVSEPKKISVNGVISDAAFQFRDDDPFTETQSIILPHKKADGTTSDILIPARRVPIVGRSVAALAELEAIRDKREIFILETRDEVFENMVFTQFDIPRDSSTGNAARVRFTAQQIETVQRRFATVPQAVDSDKASEGAETGKQVTSAASSILFDVAVAGVVIKENLNTENLEEIEAGLDTLFE